MRHTEISNRSLLLSMTERPKRSQEIEGEFQKGQEDTEYFVFSGFESLERALID